MIAQENDQPTGCRSLGQDRLEHSDLLHRPEGIDLVSLVQMIVHRVDHNAHDTLLLVRQGLSNVPGQAGVLITFQSGLVKQLRCEAWLRCRDERRMGSETLHFIECLSAFQRTAQEARAAHFGYRRECSQPNQPFGRRAEAQFDPIVGLDVRYQLAEDRPTHSVDQQQQHRGLLGRLGDDLVEYLLDRDQPRSGVTHRALICNGLTESLILGLSQLRDPVHQPYKCCGEILVWFTAAENPTRPIHESTVAGVTLSDRQQIRCRRLAARVLVRQPTGQPNGHRGAFHPATAGASQPVLLETGIDALQFLRDGGRPSVHMRRQRLPQPRKSLLKTALQFIASPGMARRADVLQNNLRLV